MGLFGKKKEERIGERWQTICDREESGDDNDQSV